MATYEEMTARLRAAPHFASGTGATDAQIEEAEKLFGTLPEDFHRYLEEFGWVHFSGYEIFGLGDDLPHPSVSFVLTTQDEREQFGLPADLVTFFNNGAGDLCCFRLLENGRQLGAEVVIFLHETRTLEAESPSFTAFMMECIHYAFEAEATI
jgi:hypothetical protein